MSHDQERPEDHRENAAKDAKEETAAKRIEADVRANRGVGLAIRPGEEKNRTEEVLERAANGNDR